jgi:hypothetical protein
VSSIDEISPMATIRYCTACGHSNDVSKELCARCGRSLANAKSMWAPDDSEEGRWLARGTRKGIWSSIEPHHLVVAAVIVFFAQVVAPVTGPIVYFVTSSVALALLGLLRAAFSGARDPAPPPSPPEPADPEGQARPLRTAITDLGCGAFWAVVAFVLFVNGGVIAGIVFLLPSLLFFWNATGLLASVEVGGEPPKWKVERHPPRVGP